MLDVFRSLRLICWYYSLRGDCCGVEDLCPGGILDRLSHGVFHLVQTVGFLEVVRGRTFDISHIYLPFLRMVEVYWKGDGNIRWLSSSARDSIVSDILARVVPGRKRSLDDVLISVHVDT